MPGAGSYGRREYVACDLRGCGRHGAVRAECCQVAVCERVVNTEDLWGCRPKNYS